MEKVKKHLKAIWIAIILLCATITGIVVIPPIINPRIPPTGATSVLRPVGDGTYHQLYPQLTTNWQKVDDTGEGDGDSTYVYTSVTDDNYYKDLYETGDFELPANNEIEKVTLYVRARSTSAARKSTWYLMVKTSAEYEYLAGSPSTDYILYSKELLTNPNGSDWTESAINAMEIGEKGKSKEFISIYAGWCTQCYAVVTYSVKLQYSNFGKSSNVTARENCKFYANWTTGVAYYIFEHNNTGSLTNYTYSFAGETWSNQTLVLNESGDCYIQGRFYANNTGGQWNKTDVLTFYCWLPLPNVLERNLGNTIGGSHWSGAIYYNGTDGGVPAIYTCFSNSSFSPYWYHQVAAFNLNSEIWTDTFNVTVSEGASTHYNPAISVLPDGRLIMFSGYNMPIKYKISTYNATIESNLTKLVTNWGSQQTFSSSISYPMPLRWDDRLIVVARQGGSIEGNYTYCEWNGTAFENMTSLLVFSEETCSLYAYVQKIGNKVLIAYNKRDYPQNFTGVYCIYSADQGKNWKKWNGTALSTPIDGNQGLCVDSSHLTQPYAPVIDENNHLVIWAYKDGYPKLAQYSKGIGESGGSWNFQNITYVNGTQIKGFSYGVQYQDQYYGRPSGWGSIGTWDGYGNRISKIVRQPGETHKFHVVWQKSDAQHVSADAGHYFSNVVDAPEAYEALIMQEYYSVFNITVMPDVVEPVGNYAYGVKYNCTLSGTLTGVKFWWNKTAAQVEKYRGYIYNTTLYCLAVGTWAEHQYGGANHTGWGDVSSLTCEVTAGTEYYVCFMFYAPENINFRMDDGATNQYFNVSVTPGQNPPLQITGQTYDSKKFTIKAIISVVIVHGIGRKFPTSLSVGWNEFTAWTVDVGRTLEEINASLLSDDVDWSQIVIVYPDSSYYMLFFGWGGDVTVEVSSSSDTFYMLINEAGKWNHNY